MAGLSQGAPAPSSPSPLPAPHGAPHGTPTRPPYRIPTGTRTRRLHAVFSMGDDLASVHSTRREVEARGVIVTLSDGAQWLSVQMLPAQARALTRSLLDAAEAVELSQRQDGGSTGQCAGLALAQEGGAA